MESFGFQNDMKVEKASAMRRYSRLRKVTALFRLIELFVFLIALSRFSTLLPVACRLSGGYVRELFAGLISPRFVFIIGNLIVVTLFWKSSSSQQGSKIDYYDEYVKSCQKTQVFVQSSSSNKQGVRKREEKRFIERSQSEKLVKNMVQYEKPCRELKRSATETCLEEVIDNGGGTRAVVAVDEMSNEDFRLRVEAFIARQQRFLREEDEDFTATVSL